MMFLVCNCILEVYLNKLKVKWIGELGNQIEI
jgi:hypothetical protein